MNLQWLRPVRAFISKVFIRALPVQFVPVTFSFCYDGYFRLINKLNSTVGKPVVAFKAKATSSFVALNNIENFNNAAKDFGVPATALFQPPDLYEGRKGPMLNVVNCLNQLGFVVSPL